MDFQDTCEEPFKIFAWLDDNKYVIVETFDTFSDANKYLENLIDSTASKKDIQALHKKIDELSTKIDMLIKSMKK